MRKELDRILPVAPGQRWLALLILLIALHSIVLGVFIFFFTEFFYRIFFNADMENFFFVRQSGLFLFCLGLFYCAPLTDLAGRHRLIVAIVLTKVAAVLFLLTHAEAAANPAIILLAAVVDGGMALLLTAVYRSSGLGQPSALPVNLPKQMP